MQRSLRRLLAVATVATVAAALPALPASAATPSTTTLKLSSSGIRNGEMIWLTGKVTAAGKASPGRSVRIERRLGGGAWHTVGTSTTSSSGTFTVRQRPAKEYTYRARAAATATRAADTSPTRTVRHTVGDRTLGARAAILASRIGAPTGSIVKARVDGHAVAYRSYRKGLLVKVSSTVRADRTWLVYGDILATYRARGGPKGWLGLPLADPRCGLLEGGCVQRFQHGSIYDNRHTKGVVAAGSSRATEVIAAARSQVGYKQKVFNSSKYNAWVGRNGAWCSIFQSWAAVASGNPGVIPKQSSWRAFLADVRAHERLGSTPKVGALVFFDTITDSSTAATHVGLVVKVKKSSIVTIEANTSTPGGHGEGRGVYQKERPRSWALYYAYPVY
ncbi:CHAP domain-containing protein [Cellulomonas edaphi]|uniref:CHAP domain-containing protein n=1 Tax=Cellulomonas edaphi TaxID=3053468 RepID=A0ABT7S835_9CELL|nr:CHAP domain-containing protein [Cellulomons edaphi]MDM7831767.1 CHAP domain-containing protein [Cellulomons edaphi]